MLQELDRIVSTWIRETGLNPITIGWVCQKAHTLSQPAERFIQLLQKYGRDLPEA